MKVAQNDDTNPDTLSVSLSDAPSLAHLQLFARVRYILIVTDFNKLNRCSDGKTYYTKVAQKNPTSLIVPSVSESGPST